MTPTVNPVWKWWVCGLLFLATTLNYMDRQTLAQTSKRILEEFALNESHYGWLEGGFGIAYAVGAVASGYVVDWYGVRWVYPAVVLLWSLAGFLTGYVRNYEELFACRMLLGFFEAANWPCAVKTTRLILDPAERSFGNGLMQSGTAIGAVLTPMLVFVCITQWGYSWRVPFLLVGLLGTVWVVAWVGSVRVPLHSPPPAPGTGPTWAAIFADRRFWVCAVMVVAINITWHFFRAWMPLFVQNGRGYSEADMQKFAIVYYIVADIGSLVVGAVALGLVRRGWTVHGARMVGFVVCSLLTLSTLVVAWLPAGIALLGLLLVVAFAALGLFPLYFAWSQDLSAAHQGKVTGVLGAICWLAIAVMQVAAGELLKGKTYDLGWGPWAGYDIAVALAGVPPLFAVVVMVWYWPTDSGDSHNGRTQNPAH
jgi:ACS family hexuronate transporter-like MFS transporter